MASSTDSQGGGGDVGADVLEIDGSVMEGGGQILRIAASLSCLTGRPIRVSKIRAGRTKPGLRPQHVMGLKLVSEICGGRLDGAVEGSQSMLFHPGQIKSGSYEADTKTAGSIALLLQISLPCLLFGGGRSRLTLRGGTDADMAPPIDYITMVLLPALKRFGINVECTIKRRGFFPRGQGEVIIEIESAPELPPHHLTKPGRVCSVGGRCYVAGALPRHLLDRMYSSAVNIINNKITKEDISIEKVAETRESAFGNGNGITLLAETDTGCCLGASALGKRGVTAEDVGRFAADKLVENIKHGGCVDEYLQDQLIIFMTLAKGKSAVLCGPITEHTHTAIHIAQLITKAVFHLTPQPDGVTTLLECEGIGMMNRNMG